MMIHNDGEQSRVVFCFHFEQKYLLKKQIFGEGDMCETEVKFDRTKNKKISTITFYFQNDRLLSYKIAIVKLADAT